MIKRTELMDTNTDLICFNNGVYDLNKREFRKGLPSDYISISTGSDFPNPENNENISNIKNMLKLIFPDKDIRNDVLIKMSKYLIEKQ